MDIRIRRAAVSFDKVIVGVLHNSSKSPLFSVQERVNILEKATQSRWIVTSSGQFVDGNPG